MKLSKKFSPFLFILSLQLLGANLIAQTGNWLSPHGGGEVNIETTGLCLNEEDRAAILENIKANIAQLNLKRKNSNILLTNGALICKANMNGF